MQETTRRNHGSYVELYVHLVWTTRQRMPLVDVATEARLYACVLAECKSLNAETVAIGGTEDHVHLLVRIPSTLNVALIAKQSKGASSHLMTHELGHSGFRWQEGYSAFTISRWDVPDLTLYIRNQKEHHRLNTAKPVLEPC